jgi:hypothetical protein
MLDANGAGVACARAAATPGGRRISLFADRSSLSSRGPSIAWSTRTPPLLLLAALLALAGSAGAQGLYGPEAPRDAAYLRLVNAGGAEPATMTVDGDEWEPVPFAEVSPYRQVRPGDHSLALSGEEITVTAHPEGFITVVALPGRILTLEDTPLRDITRGLLTLYNLSDDGALTLRTHDGTEVLADVAPESSASIAISEAEVGLAVYREGEEVGSLPPRLYSRGEAHSIIVLPPGSEPRVIYAPAGAER